MNKFAVVAIGYNRAACMKRLLTSVEQALYDQNVDLIISIDNSGTTAVEEMANEFEWTHGEKRVVTHPERLGLKKHVLECGGYTEQYENIVVFEDDLYVSPHYFEYVKQCVDMYGDDDRIAGIGLYNNNLDQNSGYRFEAVQDGYDVYFMQYACSWGQVWTQKKWRKFMEWYQDNSAPFSDDEVVPPNVNRWNERSWLKYHVKYCAETKRFFAFPHVSLTTNFSSLGSHSKFDDNAYQIALSWGEKQWRLPSLEESHSKYDVYFENLDLAEALNLPSEDLCIDTYGQRKNSGGKRYWLTTRAADYRVLSSYALEFRPRDANVLAGIPGSMIKLYDTQVEEKYTLLSEKEVIREEIHYIVGATSLKKLMAYCRHTFLQRLWLKIRGKR